MTKNMFLVEITYLVPAEELGDILPEHRSFLKGGYEKGLLLVSGPKQPRVGGIAIACASTMDEVKEFFSNDPYQKHNLAEYRFVEFVPVLHQDFLSDWIA
ncbi:MAG TPA: YciI family protein [Anaerolineaceae bacterium]|jgi:uncharacterized protein YciI|nr:YciI family protein [Anaerolineaceae bacterium]HOH18748.1 YciI family protein [Anaerolineaceae bacterium]